MVIIVVVIKVHRGGRIINPAQPWGAFLKPLRMRRSPGTPISAIYYLLSALFRLILSTNPTDTRLSVRVMLPAARSSGQSLRWGSLFLLTISRAQVHGEHSAILGVQTALLSRAYWGESTVVPSSFAPFRININPLFMRLLALRITC